MFNVLRFFGVLGALLLIANAANAEQSNYVKFFNAGNGAYVAYLDHNNQGSDAAGNHLVNVKLDTFDDAMRGIIKQYWPGGESADYSITAYGVNCPSHQTAEHTMVYYDKNGFPLTAAYDYGGTMKTPIAGSMDFYLMQEICGL